MPTMYDDVNARCPYFCASDKQKVACEGVTDGCRTVIEFNSHNKRDRYREMFCNARYEQCKVYKMLEEKYDEKK